MIEPFEWRGTADIPPRELGAPSWQQDMLAEVPLTEGEVASMVAAIPVRGFPRFDLDKLADDPPDRDWILPGYIPAREVTLFTGPGGAGKSLFAQQLATAVATGAPMLGLPTPGGDETNALYVTAEDGEDELWRRQPRCLAAIGKTRADLSDDGFDWLHLVSLRGRIGNELVTFDRDGELQTTEAFDKLRDTLVDTGASLLILDNVGHLFAGNENDRGQVTRFVNALYKLVRTYGVTILLVAHPNKSGDDYSGSTAWRNAVRSQINLARLEGEAGELDPDARNLSVSKANYSRMGEELRFRWHHGAFVRDEDLPTDYAAQLAESIRVQGENETFLRCLRARMEQPGREVGPNLGANYAPARFAEMTEAKGLSKQKLAHAMERLLHVGTIKTDQIKRKGSDMKTIIVEAS